MQWHIFYNINILIQYNTILIVRTGESSHNLKIPFSCEQRHCQFYQQV